MTKITLRNKPLQTEINLPAVGSNAPNFTLVASDLSEKSLGDYQGKKLILNIFPSVDTPTCAISVKRFNQQAAALNNVEVLCISADLPFAQSRFCGAENTDKVTTLSAFRSTFGKDYGLVFTDSPLKGLLTRCVIVLDETGKVTYSQVVSEVADEPDYESALAAI